MKVKKAFMVVLALLLIVYSGCLAQENTDETPWTTRVQDLANARIAIVTGSLQTQILPNVLPDAQYTEFNLIADAASALALGKVDAFSAEDSVYLAMRREGQNFVRIDEPLFVSEYGMVFGNGRDPQIKADFNAFLAKCKENGVLAAQEEKWFGETEPQEVLPLSGFAPDGKPLSFVTTTQKPYAYVKNGSYTGYDVELMILFAREYGYNLEVVDSTFGGILTGIEQGKYDIGGSGITITQERRESMDFSDVYHIEDVVMVVSGHAAGAEKGDWLSSLKASFDKTFIRESRWKLIVQGLGNTILISLCAVVGGTAFGFALYMLARSRYRAVSAITRTVCRVYTRLIAGTPTLVVLMILFYIVFGKTDVSGIWVAMLGFALTFGSFVYSHLTLSVEGVARGQTEAAYALGYTRNQTFFRIVLPQSMKVFLPTYTGEVVSLIKATSVVGYIAVSDLTKMGDIIRSNTYEAVFPLLAVAVIYFVITWGAASLLGLVQKKLDNHRRKNKNILKGVVR